MNTVYLENGELGYGNTLFFSDVTNFGNDVDLGTAVEVVQIGSGDEYNCALTTTDYVKCWGTNSNGQLGQEHSDTMGDQAGEMGDNLPYTALGDDFDGHISEICVGGGHSCALSDGNDIKCWGKNDRGQLGYGDTANRGNVPGQMGNDLPVVDMGTSFTAQHIYCGEEHTCALSDIGDVKCWGMFYVLIHILW